MKIINYKNFDSSNLSLTLPYKNERGNHCIDFKYNNQEFFLQTPEINIEITEEERDSLYFYFNTLTKGLFYKILQDIEDNVVSSLKNNSMDFFGKRFSENKFKKSIQKFYCLDNTTFRSISIKLDKDLKVYNSENKLTDLQNNSFKGVSILSLKGLEFISKEEIQFNLSVKFLKVSFYKTSSCLLDEEQVKDEEPFF